jgi:glycine/D-amino acid oxidase-like deaminating enzyme
MIWADPQRLWVSEDERAAIGDQRAEWRTREFPAGVHLRPEGGPDSDALLLIWSYDDHSGPPVFPPTFDPAFAEICLRGLVRMVPGLAAYVGRTPRPIIDGGYYTKTRENRPLIGPLPARGLYADCAFGGFGIMAACGAAMLLADHITGAPLPDYAPAFLVTRYEDPAYVAAMALARSGQL